MTPVLVTGGAGYIGSHTVKLLTQSSAFFPVVFDNLSTGHEWAVSGAPLVHGDLEDSDLIRKTLRRHRIQGVIHFAASAYVGESIHHPQKYFRNNVANTLNLLEAMKETGVGRIVFSSSCATYGVPTTCPIPESHPQQPVSPYGESKLFAERMLRWYGEAYGLKWVALRYFNAAGADPEGELGEQHDPETHLIPSAIEAATGARRQLELYGTDYETVDGTAVRDFIHVMDLARAHVLALQYLRAGEQSTAFNLGTGQGYSVQEVIRAVEVATDIRVPVRKMPARAGDAPVLIADSSKAHRELGWKPQYRNLQPIVETAWAWHRRGRRQQAATA